MQTPATENKATYFVPMAHALDNKVLDTFGFHVDLWAEKH